MPGAPRKKGPFFGLQHLCQGPSSETSVEVSFSPRSFNCHLGMERMPSMRRSQRVCWERGFRVPPDMVFKHQESNKKIQKIRVFGTPEIYCIRFYSTDFLHTHTHTHAYQYIYIYININIYIYMYN